MTGNIFYFDDTEGDALAKETSHPVFTKKMTAEFYYDCTDNFSPFGNDDGAEILSNLEEFYRKKKGKGNITKWLFKVIDDFGFEYASEGCSKILDELTLKKLHDEDPHFINCMDNAILAAAFGQIKICGQVDNELRNLAEIAIQRQIIMNKHYDNESAAAHNKNLKIMLNDLRKIQ